MSRRASMGSDVRSTSQHGVVQAPGKAMLFGEYAVLDGAPALVAAVNRYAVAVHDPKVGAPSGPFVTASLAAAHVYAAERNVAIPDGAPRVDSLDLYEEGESARKLGLGSSAAVTVAAFGAAIRAAGLPLDEPRAIFAACEAAHSEAQGGRGSGADVAASVWGGVIRFSRAPGGALIDPVQLSATVDVTLVDTGVAASTAERLRRLDGLRREQPARYKDLVRPLADLAAAVAGEVAYSGEIPVAAVHEWNRALEALAAALDLPIITDAIRAADACARRVGGAAKPSGAGGGDLAVCFTPRGHLDELTRALDGAGLRTFASHELTIGAPGLGAVTPSFRQP